MISLNVVCAHAGDFAPVAACHCGSCHAASSVSAAGNALRLRSASIS